MTDAQRRMCFKEWRPCWVAMCAARGSGFPVDERAARLGVTFKAIGKAKSWGDPWTQKEVDRILAVMWSIAQAGNLNLQLRQVNQPITRMESSLFAQAMLAAIGVEQHGREAYVNGICRRIHKRNLVDISDAEWIDVLAALNHTRMHKTGVAHSHPRSTWQRRGGRNRAGAGAPAKKSAAPSTGAAARTGGPEVPNENPF